MRGRREALPAGPTSTHGLLEGADRLVVRRFSQDGIAWRDFDFTDLPCAPLLRQALAEAFTRRTAPGTRFTSLVSMNKVAAVAKHFAHHLAGLRWPPRDVLTAWTGLPHRTGAAGSPVDVGDGSLMRTLPRMQQVDPPLTCPPQF